MAPRGEPGSPPKHAGFRAQFALLATLTTASALVWRLGAWRARFPQGSFRMPLVAFAVVVGISEGLQVAFEFRRHNFRFVFSEIALVLGLAFCSPGAMAVGTAIGAIAAHTARRNGTLRTALNTSLRTLEFGVARIVFAHLAQGTSLLSPSGWAAGFAAVGAGYVVNAICVTVGIRVLSGALPPRTVSVQMAINMVVAASNGAIGMLAAVCIWAQPWAGVLLVFVVAIMSVGYRGYTIMRQRYANLRLLYAFSAALADAQTEDDVVGTVLAQSAKMLNAERATLTIETGAHMLHITLDPDSHAVPSRLSDLDPLRARVVNDAEPIVVPRSGRTPYRTELDALGCKDAVMVPLAVGDKTDGVLAVCDRSTDENTFDREDLRLLGALAAHATIAIRNGQLVDRLTREAATRAHQALHDSLTGLGNRTLFTERVKTALETPGDLVIAVMLMDLDEFKEINDTLGHHTGDSVLREVAARLSRTVGLRGTVARLGGDEFAVAIPGCRSAAEAVDLAQLLSRVVNEPLQVDDLTLEVRASIGVALSPDHGSEPATLLQRADVAMYAAKSAGMGVEIYAPDRDHYSHRRLALSTDLRHAMEAGELTLNYQPKVDLAEGRVVGLEALLRWHHPRYGFIPPDEFIPVAEQSSLIQPLTRWVLTNAVAQLAAWREEGFNLTMAVNLSARNLLDSVLVEDVRRILDRANVPTDCMVLELTETSVMSDPGRNEAIMHALAGLGCRLSIDDFGTGYSSLSRLKRLPVDEVKIDKSFVMQMASDSDDAVIVRSIIDLARNLGLHVTAEGVEDAEALVSLRAYGCDAVQGFFIMRPSTADVVSEWLAGQPVDRLPVARHHRRTAAVA